MAVEVTELTINIIQVLQRLMNVVINEKYPIIPTNPASTGGVIDNEKEVKKILRGYEGKNNDMEITERLDAFNEVTIKLIDPDKGDNPTKCKGKNMKSIEELFIIGGGT